MLNFSSNTNMTISMINMDMPLDIIIYGSFFYTLIFILGVSGNSMVIYVLMKEKELRNFTNYLLANLSIADLLVLFTCVPTAFHDLFAKERWYLGQMMCHLMAFIENCVGNASLLSIFLITIERYYVICRPLNVRSMMTPSRTLKLLSMIWLVCITINLPFIFLTEYKKYHFYDKNTDEYKCNTKSPNWISFYYLITVTFIIYVVIGIVLLGMYYKISKSLKKSTLLLQSSTNKHCLSDYKISFSPSNDNCLVSKKRQNNNEDCDAKVSFLLVKNSPYRSSNSSVTNRTYNFDKCLNLNNTLERYIKPRKQLIYMLMCVIIVFYVCLFPLKLWNLTLMFIGHKPYFPKLINLRNYWYLSITFRIFFYTNSFINPILYNCLSKRFRNGFKKLSIFKICFHDKALFKKQTCELETKNTYLM